MSIDSLLKSYPRQRVPLSPPMQRLYEETYLESRSQESVSSKLTHWLESWMHRQVAGAGATGSVLELGGGTLNHLPYERQDAPYDVVEPFEALYRDSPNRSKVRTLYASIGDIPPGTRYDRILSIAVLEHITDLPGFCAQAAAMLAPGGVFQAGLPSEGGLLWALSWRLGKALPFWFKTRLDYGEMVRHEHVSRLDEILPVIRHVFRSVTVRHHPLPGLHLSLYAYVEARDPDPEVIAALGQGQGHPV